MENSGIEELLQLLVAVVDAELLKAVHLIVLCETHTHSECKRALDQKDSNRARCLYYVAMRENQTCKRDPVSDHTHPTRPLTEAGYVQHANIVAGGGEGEALVDSAHYVVKELDVQRLGQGVPGSACLARLQRHAAGASDRDFNAGFPGKLDEVVVDHTGIYVDGSPMEYAKQFS